MASPTTNNNSNFGIDFSLKPRRKPSSQVERIPFLDDDIQEDLDSRDLSVRANFLPPAYSPTTVSDSIMTDDWKLEDCTATSPVFTNLPQIKPSRLYVASEEAQRLRRKLLRGANVLIVQAGYSGKRFIYERLKELGVEITIMDGKLWTIYSSHGIYCWIRTNKNNIDL